MVDIGLDIVNVGRIKATVERYGSRFLLRVFTEKELKGFDKITDNAYRFQHIAGLFGAKEAIKKCVGVHIPFKCIEVIKDDSGKPAVYIDHRKRFDISVSITHTAEYSAAVAIKS